MILTTGIAQIATPSDLARRLSILPRAAGRAFLLRTRPALRVELDHRYLVAQVSDVAPLARQALARRLRLLLDQTLRCPWKGLIRRMKWGLKRITWLRTYHRALQRRRKGVIGLSKHHPLLRGFLMSRRQPRHRRV